MTNVFEQTKQFNEAFNSRVGRDDENIDLRFKLLREEYNEYVTAYTEGNHADALDAIIDMIYIAAGTCHILGYNGEEAFKRVHAANMAKLGVDGKPIINGENGVYDASRPMGKVLKPNGWAAPVLDDLI